MVKRIGITWCSVKVINDLNDIKETSNLVENLKDDGDEITCDGPALPVGNECVLPEDSPDVCPPKCGPIPEPEPIKDDFDENGQYIPKDGEVPEPIINEDPIEVEETETEESEEEVEEVEEEDNNAEDGSNGDGNDGSNGDGSDDDSNGETFE